MKRFCLFLIIIGAVLWWLCDIGLLLDHPLFFTVSFTLSLSLALSALMDAFDLRLDAFNLRCTVTALEKRIDDLETQLQHKES